MEKKTAIELFTEGFATQGAEDAKRNAEEVGRRSTDAKAALETAVKNNTAIPLQVLQYGFEHSEPIRKRGQELKIDPNNL